MAQGVLSFKYVTEKRVMLELLFQKISDGWEIARLEIDGFAKSLIL